MVHTCKLVCCGSCSDLKLPSVAPAAGVAACIRPSSKHWLHSPAALDTAAAAGTAPAYPYNSGDDRKQKATIEHIFKPDFATHDASSATAAAEAAAAPDAGRIQAPWAVGWQMNERNIMWNDDLKLRLIKRIASQELGVSESELEERLQQLHNLLPDLADRLVKAPPQQVAKLAASTGIIAARLLRLRQIFPEANASSMVSNRLSLLLDDDLDQLTQAAQRLRELLPQIHVDRFVEAYPLVLDVEDFEMALADAKRIMPHIDAQQMLRSNPDMILSLQKGKNLIPYDQIANPWS